MTTEFMTVADTAYTLELITKHIYVISINSTNSAYQCLYFLVKPNSSNTYVIPVKTASGVTVTASGATIQITTNSYPMPITLIDLTKFEA
ncbi:MAG: hypothetical protein K0R92_507 [Lachnospiraceae bacterium]|jgi:hypothetical protein|nr:hypothetical protein [Lachnospiraceae bacterium]